MRSSPSFSTWRKSPSAQWMMWKHAGFSKLLQTMFRCKVSKVKIRNMLLSEQNLVSPILSFFSFWHNLKMPIARYIVYKFHDEWTKKTWTKTDWKSVWFHWLILKVKYVFSLSCKVIMLEIQGFVLTVML